MIIIYEGTLAITAELDAGQEVVLEYIKKGTILNSHNFLSERPITTNIKCLTSVTYYYLPVSRLQDISANYPALRSCL